MAELLMWIAKPLLGNQDIAKGKGSVGFKVPEKDRVKYFIHDGSPVHLHLMRGSTHTLLSITPSASFWTSTGELISTDIRRWVDETRGLEKWLTRSRPKVLAWPLDKNCFAILGFKPDEPTEEASAMMDASAAYQWLLQKGRLNVAKSFLSKWATQRFGAPSNEAHAALHGITDLGRVERLADQLLDATGWDDLLKTD